MRRKSGDHKKEFALVIKRLSDTLGHVVKGLFGLALVTSIVADTQLFGPPLPVGLKHLVRVQAAVGQVFPANSVLRKDAERALADSFPEAMNMGIVGRPIDPIVQAMCFLIVTAMEVRKATGGRGLLDVCDGYCGRASISLAAQAQNLRRLLSR